LAAAIGIEPMIELSEPIAFKAVELARDYRPIRFMPPRPFLEESMNYKDQGLAVSIV
jgi:hypothetical protein